MNKLLTKLPSKGRFRFFLLFVLLSFVFWLSTKLSNSYTLDQSFKVNWEDVPSGIVLSNIPQQLTLSISASGMELLLYRWLNSEIDISLKDVVFNSNEGKIDLRNQYFLIGQQLFDNTQLNQVVPSQVAFGFTKLEEKKLEVIPKVNVQFRAGYLGDSPMKSSPDSVLVRGPKTLLDSLKALETIVLKVEDLFEDYNQKVALKTIPELQLDRQEVQVQMDVSRYSEKELTLPIEVLNIPEGIRVKLFPASVKIRATLPLSLLRTVNESDFKMAVDYHSLTEENNFFEVVVLRKPPMVKQLNWEPKQVNYLIRK